MTAQTKQFGLRAVAILLVVAFLAFGGIGLTGVAAQSSIPGDALYPVKTSIEQTRLSLAQDAGDRAQMKMAFAQERLNEIDALIQEGRYREVNQAVLAFESNINSAIVELEILSKADPTRAGQLALEITATLSHYAQTLSDLVARVPESVKAEVDRALDTTQVVGGMQMLFGNDNPNGNDNDDDDGNSNANDNDDDGNSNVNSNDNDDDSNSNSNDNSNVNNNDNDDDSNSNDDDDSNANSNDNDDDSNSNDDDDSDVNSNDDDESNSNDDEDDSNSNDDDDSNDNGDDSSDDDDSNDNDDDDNDDDDDDDD